MTSAGSTEEMEEVRALYRKEAMQRKLLYNQVLFSKTYVWEADVIALVSVSASTLVV